MATVKAIAPKSICGDFHPKLGGRCNKSSMVSSKSRNTGPPLPQFYIDTIVAAFGEEADLHRDVFRVSPDAMPMEQRIAYFKRGREIMKEAESHFIAPTDLPPPIRARLKAINMAYEIISNPEWHRQYLLLSESTGIKSNGVRFNDHIEERVFEREPWEEDYMRDRRGRRMRRYQEPSDSDAQESFWSDFLMDMENFEFGLDGFMQAFPDRISNTESNDSADVPPLDESFISSPDTQSLSSWLSPKLERPKKEPSPASDSESTSYLSSFNPFGEEPAKNIVSSPTSLDQELAQFSQTSNPFEKSPKDISNPFSDASDARFGIGTFQNMQNKRRARQTTLSTGRQVSKQSIGGFDHQKVSNAYERTTENKEQSQRNIFPSTSGNMQEQSRTDPFYDEPEDPEIDISGDQTSVFDGLEDAWEDDGVHVEGVSVISDLSESVVAKRARERQMAFNPFGYNDVTKEDTRDSSQKNTSLGNPNWGGSEDDGEAGFASSLASRVASLVADCERNSNAVANFNIHKDFFPSLFSRVESEKNAKEQDESFDKENELFSDMGGF